MGEKRCMLHVMGGVDMDVQRELGDSKGACEKEREEE